MKKIEKIEKKIGESCHNVFIWLHGLGADASDFFSFTEVLSLKQTLFVFPNAPICPVSINQGMKMRSWYDITSLDIKEGTHHQDLENSVSQIEDLIADYLKQGFSPEKITLGGFSQGGVVSLALGYKNKHKISKIIGFSCYLTTHTLKNTHHKKPKILLSHGVEDSVIPISYGRMAKNILQKEDFFVQWEEYPIEHSVCEEQIKSLNIFLQS